MCNVMGCTCTLDRTLLPPSWMQCCHDMTKFYFTYLTVRYYDMTICHDIKGTVLNFESFKYTKAQ